MAETLNTNLTPYQPKPDEEYMSKNQLKHSRKMLDDWKAELSNDIDRTVHHMQDEVTMFADPNDRASQESDMALELRNRDRERRNRRKYDGYAPTIVTFVANVGQFDGETQHLGG